jgi:hypothetical protein
LVNWIYWPLVGTHHSELQVITALSLISALYRSLAHAMSSHSSLERLLATASNRNSSASRAQVLFVTAAHAELNPTHSIIAPSLQSSTEPTNELFRVRVTLLLAVYRQSVRLQDNPWRVPFRKYRSFIVACVFVPAGKCLPIRYSETAFCLFAYCISKSLDE